MDLYKKNMETRGNYDNPIEINDDSDLDALSDGYNSPSESPEFPPSPPVMDDVLVVHMKRNKDSKKPTYVNFDRKIDIDIEKLEEIDVMNFHHFEEQQQQQNDSPYGNMTDTPPREKKRNVQRNDGKNEPPAKKVRFAANVDRKPSKDDNMSDPDYEDEGSPDGEDNGETPEEKLDAVTISNYEDCFDMGKFEHYDEFSQDLIIKFQRFAPNYFKKIRISDDTVSSTDKDTNTWYTNLYEYDEEKLVEKCNDDSHAATERSFFIELVKKIRVYVLKPRVNDSNVIMCVPMGKRWGSLEYNNYLSAGDWHDFYIIKRVRDQKTNLTLNNTANLMKGFTREQFGSFTYGIANVLLPKTAKKVQVPLACYQEVRLEVANYLKNKSLPEDIHANTTKVKLLHDGWKAFGSVEVEYAYDQYHRREVLRRLKQDLIDRKCFFAFSKSQKKRAVRDEELYLIAINPNIANTGDIFDNLLIIYLHRIENVLLPVGDPVGYVAHAASDLRVSFSFLMHSKEDNFAEGKRKYLSLPLNHITRI